MRFFKKASLIFFIFCIFCYAFYASTDLIGYGVATILTFIAHIGYMIMDRLDRLDVNLGVTVEKPKS